LEKCLGVAIMKLIDETAVEDDVLIAIRREETQHLIACELRLFASHDRLVEAFDCTYTFSDSSVELAFAHSATSCLGGTHHPRFPL
jgi:hypothetical protein